MKVQDKYKWGDSPPRMCVSVRLWNRYHNPMEVDMCNRAFNIWCKNCKYGLVREFANNTWIGCTADKLNYTPCNLDTDSI